MAHLWRCHDWGEWILERTSDNRKVLLRHVETLIALSNQLATDPSEGERNDPAIAALVERANLLASEVFAEDPHDREARRICSMSEQREIERLRSGDPESGCTEELAPAVRTPEASAEEQPITPVSALSADLEVGFPSLIARVEGARAIVARSGWNCRDVCRAQDTLAAWIRALGASGEPADSREGER